MVTVVEIINESKRIANLGIGVDQDGVYGTQCVDYLTTYQVNTLVKAYGVMLLIY